MVKSARQPGTWTDLRGHPRCLGGDGWKGEDQRGYRDNGFQERAAKPASDDCRSSPERRLQMKLHLRRDQIEKNEKVLFTLAFKVELSPREQATLRKHGADTKTLMEIPTKDYLTSRIFWLIDHMGMDIMTAKDHALRELGPVIEVEVVAGKTGRLVMADLINGQSYRFTSVAERNAAEERIKFYCASLKAWLDDVSQPRRDEVIEF